MWTHRGKIKPTFVYDQQLGVQYQLVVAASGVGANVKNQSLEASSKIHFFERQHQAVHVHLQTHTPFLGTPFLGVKTSKPRWCSHRTAVDRDTLRGKPGSRVEFLRRLLFTHWQNSMLVMLGFPLTLAFPRTYLVAFLLSSSFDQRNPVLRYRPCSLLVALVFDKVASPSVASPSSHTSLSSAVQNTFLRWSKWIWNNEQDDKLKTLRGIVIKRWKPYSRKLQHVVHFTIRM